MGELCTFGNKDVHTVYPYLNGYSIFIFLDTS